jgi:cyclopropane-fatty-acyl-phospholipid synthase
MALFSLQQDIAEVRADFAFYGLAVAVAASLALATLPHHRAWQAAAWSAAGLIAWTLMEYLLHRFVLHGLQPFQRWHALHHAQPRALLATPTVLTAALFALLVVLPAGWLLPTWNAAALVLGVLAGYVGYIGTHHAVHHVQGRSAWLRSRKRWHARHHTTADSGCFGVTVPIWDHVFGTTRPRMGGAVGGVSAPP